MRKIFNDKTNKLTVHGRKLRAKAQKKQKVKNKFLRDLYVLQDLIDDPHFME